MRMPGFTADATLYRSPRHYCTAASAVAGREVLALQLVGPSVARCATRCASFCQRQCAAHPQTCNFDSCFEECIDVSCCEEHCQPCKLFGGECQQFCVDDDCSQGMRPCTCPSGQACTGDGCCPDTQKCGAAEQFCCTGTEVCADQRCCTPCGTDCCDRGMLCKNGQCCTVHGNYCCTRVEIPYNQGCCPVQQYCGPDVCCPPGKVCLGTGVCCDPHSACSMNPPLCCETPGQKCCHAPDGTVFCGVACGAGNACCRPGEVCCKGDGGDVCCPPGNVCCNGKCFSAGSVCCGSIACPPGAGCCGDHCCPLGSTCCMNNRQGSGGVGCCYADGPDAAYCCTRGDIATCCRLGDTCCFSRFDNGRGQIVEVPYCCPKNGDGAWTCAAPDSKLLYFCIDQNDPHRGTGGYTSYQPPFP